MDGNTATAPSLTTLGHTWPPPVPAASHNTALPADTTGSTRNENTSGLDGLGFPTFSSADLPSAPMTCPELSYSSSFDFSHVDTSLRRWSLPTNSLETSIAAFGNMLNGIDGDYSATTDSQHLVSQDTPNLEYPPYVNQTSQGADSPVKPPEATRPELSGADIKEEATEISFLGYLPDVRSKALIDPDRDEEMLFDEVGSDFGAPSGTSRRRVERELSPDTIQMRKMMNRYRLDPFTACDGELGRRVARGSRQVIPFPLPTERPVLSEFQVDMTGDSPPLSNEAPWLSEGEAPAMDTLAGPEALLERPMENRSVPSNGYPLRPERPSSALRPPSTATSSTSTSAISNVSHQASQHWTLPTKTEHQSTYAEYLAPSRKIQLPALTPSQPQTYSFAPPPPNRTPREVPSYFFPSRPQPLCAPVSQGEAQQQPLRLPSIVRALSECVPIDVARARLQGAGSTTMPSDLVHPARPTPSLSLSASLPNVESAYLKYFPAGSGPTHTPSSMPLFDPFPTLNCRQEFSNGNSNVGQSQSAHANSMYGSSMSNGHNSSVGSRGAYDTAVLNSLVPMTSVQMPSYAANVTQSPSSNSPPVSLSYPPSAPSSYVAPGASNSSYFVSAPSSYPMLSSVPSASTQTVAPSATTVAGTESFVFSAPENNWNSNDTSSRAGLITPAQQSHSSTYSSEQDSLSQPTSYTRSEAALSSSHHSSSQHSSSQHSSNNERDSEDLGDTSSEEESPPPSAGGQEEEQDGDTPNKSACHPCQVCTKSFPKASTLATHMSTHTGEKPHVCPVHGCGRRFSVQSNMRRHQRRCALGLDGRKRIKKSLFASYTSSKSENLDGGIVSARLSASDPLYISCESASRNAASAARRRAPSATSAKAKRPPLGTNAPNRWVPESLKFCRNVGKLTSKPPFDFGLQFMALSAPLPPVRPYGSPRQSIWEERDSYASYGPEPYHASYWEKLPGPALLSPEELMRNATMSRRWQTDTQSPVGAMVR